MKICSYYIQNEKADLPVFCLTHKMFQHDIKDNYTFFSNAILEYEFWGNFHSVFKCLLFYIILTFSVCSIIYLTYFR